MKWNWQRDDWPYFIYNFKALEGLEGFKGGLSAENYISITGAARATAKRDLADLVEQGILIKSGQRRYTRYMLNIGAH